MMEWETGIHMCNKHEMNLQVVFLNRCKRKKLLLKAECLKLESYMKQIYTHTV